MESRHWEEERQERARVIEAIGKGKVIKAFRVDRHHNQGAEIHTISDTGIITVYNERTRKMITQLIARPGQIRRYFKANEAPQELLEIAYKHYRLGYNVA